MGLAGGLGAVARFALGGAIAARVGRTFPYGTLTVNLSGTLALGVAVGVGLSGDGQRILATGFLGAYTTFSTWVFESQRLGEQGGLRIGAANLVLSLALGLAVAALGRQIGMAL
jgi:CrcB protein